MKLRTGLKAKQDDGTITNAQRYGATLKWLDTIVVREKLCPFAAPVSHPPRLRIRVLGNCGSESTNSEENDNSNAPIDGNDDDIMQKMIDELNLLVGEQQHNKPSTSTIPSSQEKEEERPETTLIVFNENVYPSLQEFRNLIRLSWRVQEEAINAFNYTDLVQQVLFHPLATHDTYNDATTGMYDGSVHFEEDAANYTIRSPYPMIHLLREEDVMKAVQSGYPDLEGLPARNKAKLRQDGVHACAARLRACLEV